MNVHKISRFFCNKDDHNHTSNVEEIGVKKCISQVKEISNQSE